MVGWCSVPLSVTRLQNAMVDWCSVPLSVTRLQNAMVDWCSVPLSVTRLPHAMVGKLNRVHFWKLASPRLSRWVGSVLLPGQSPPETEKSDDDDNDNDNRSKSPPDFVVARRSSHSGDVISGKLGGGARGAGPAGCVVGTYNTQHTLTVALERSLISVGITHTDCSVGEKLDQCRYNTH